MRKLIAGMKLSLDGKIEGPDGTVDWVKCGLTTTGHAHYHAVREYIRLLLDCAQVAKPPLTTYFKGYGFLNQCAACGKACGECR